MGRINGSVGNNSDAYDYYIIYEETDIDIATNTSKLKVYSEIYCGKHTAWTGIATTHSLTIDGQTFTNTLSSINLSPGTYVKLVTAEKTITHDKDGSKSINISASSPTLPSGNGYGPQSGSASGNVSLYKIPRASSVSCADGNIGSSTTITINRASSNFTHTLEYNFADLTGTIATKTSNTSIGWSIPTSFYTKIPNALSGSGTITCKTYNGDTLIGTSTCTFNAFVVNSNPTLSATVVDSNAITKALTGDNNKMVKYFSNAQVTLTTTAKNSASIIDKKVTCGGKSLTASGTMNNVESNVFNLWCKDSRGLTASATVTKTLVNYIKLAITSLNLSRPEQTSNTINISLNGNYFNQNFGAVANELTLKFRWKESGVTYSAYTTLTATKSGNTFSYSGTLGTSFDYQKAYIFEIIVQDKLMTMTYERTVTKGIPQIDRGKNDIKYNCDVDVGGNFKIGGKNITENYLRNFNRSMASSHTNLDNPGINGFFEVRSNSEVTYTGKKPFDSFYGFLNLKTPDNVAMLQIGGNNGNLYYRGKQAANVTMSSTNWAKIRDSENWGKTLYDNSSGTTGTVTLSESAANYLYLELFFTDNNKTRLYSTKIYNPNGKKVNLFATEINNTTLNIRASTRTISGTSITVDSSLYKTIGTNGIEDTNTTNYLYITKVIGYK